MLKNVSSGTVDWQIRKWSNRTKLQILVWMIINSNRKNSKQLENWQMIARILSWNACIWHVLDDLTSCGQSKGLRDRSQNALRHVTNDWRGWFPIFVTRMTIVKSGRWYSSDMHCSQEEFGKEIFWSQTLRNWRIWTHQKSILEDQCRRSIDAWKERFFWFPMADGTAKL